MMEGVLGLQMERKTIVDEVDPTLMIEEAILLPLLVLEDDARVRRRRVTILVMILLLLEDRAIMEDQEGMVRILEIEDVTRSQRVAAVMMKTIRMM